MNKKAIFLPLFGFLALTVASFSQNTTKVHAYDSSIWEEANELGEIDEDSYFGSCWNMNDIGSKRISDRSVLISDHADWGRRGQILYKEFDLTNFYIEFDCSQLPSKTALMLCLGPEGLYASESGKLVSMDIIRGEFDTTAYMCTLSTTLGNGGHAVSIPSFTDGGTWADDSNFTGVQCFAPDGVVSLSFHKDNDVTTTVKFNDSVITVQNSELYANCVDGTTGHLSIGLINNAGPTLHYIIRDAGDDNTDYYYSDEGDFGKTKKELAEIKVLDTEGFSTDDVLALKERFDAIPYSSLYSYDKNWLSADYTSVKEKVDALVEKAGVEISLSLFEKKVAEVKEDLNNTSTVSEIDVALAAFKEAQSSQEAVDQNALNNDQQTRFIAANSQLVALEDSLKTAMKGAYESAVAKFEEAVNGTIASAEDYLNCTDLKSEIPTKYNEYFAEDYTTPLATRIEDATKTLEGKSTVPYSNWEQGVNAHAIAKEGGIDLITAGNAYGEKSETSGLYLNQALDVLDFDVVLNFSSFGNCPTGCWITFGMMEKSGMWVYAENDGIQDNKGVFFLVTKINSQTVNVQCFICSMVCNTFYDSVLTQTVQVPLGQDVKVSFTSVEKTIAGVTDTYFNMDFGGTSFDEEVIKTRTLKTVFGTGLKGYFFVASGGISTGNPAVVKIGQVNGKDPSSTDFAKAGSSTEDFVPTTTSTEVSYAIGSSDAVSYNFDSKGKTITAVKVDGKAISSGDYNYIGSTLTLSHDFLETLSEGSHTVEATTSGGSCSWKLNITKASSGGCGGSICASIALVSVVSLLGVCFLSLKKKNEQF